MYTLTTKPSLNIPVQKPPIYTIFLYFKKNFFIQPHVPTNHNQYLSKKLILLKPNE